MKTVLITGGNGDIAQAIARQLEAADWRVQAPGRDQLDVASPESVARYVREHGAPDVLINNAGYNEPQGIAAADPAVQKKVLDICLFGVFNCTNSILRVNPAAKIVNIGSTAYARPNGPWSAYCAAKAGVVMATECWAKDGVDAICISPGKTLTKMRKVLHAAPEDPDTLMRPDDFAAVVVRAIEKPCAAGTHLVVTRENVQQVLQSLCNTEEGACPCL